MDAPELELLRAKLLARRAELLALGDAELEPNREDPVAKTDEDAQPLNEMNQVLASRHNRQRVEELTAIERSLAQMASDPDDFGYCIGCEEPIPLRRLELMPGTQRCVACQAKLAGPHPTSRRRHLNDYQ